MKHIFYILFLFLAATNAKAASPLSDLRYAIETGLYSLSKAPHLVTVENPAEDLPPSETFTRLVLNEDVCAVSQILKLSFFPEPIPFINYSSNLSKS